MNGTNNKQHSPEAIAEVRRLALEGASHRTIERATGVSKAHVGRVIRGGEDGRRSESFRAEIAERRKDENSRTRRVRDKRMSELGGAWADLYCHIRDASQIAIEEEARTNDLEFRLALRAAITRLAYAEDAIVQVRGIP